MALDDIECFWIEPAPVVGTFLFRWANYERHKNISCPASAPYIHHAAVLIGTEPYDGGPRYNHHREPDAAELADTRWPKACRCGFSVDEADGKSEVVTEQLYRRPDRPELQPRRVDEWGPGLMYDAWWATHANENADGIKLLVRTPAGDWFPFSKRLTWTATGDPRKPSTFSLSPSILIDGNSERRFHAHLVNGKLVRCGDSKI